jgi:hypothetical protein
MLNRHCAPYRETGPNILSRVLAFNIPTFLILIVGGFEYPHPDLYPVVPLGKGHGGDTQSFQQSKLRKGVR